MRPQATHVTDPMVAVAGRICRIVGHWRLVPGFDRDSDSDRSLGRPCTATNAGLAPRSGHRGPGRSDGLCIGPGGATHWRHDPALGPGPHSLLWHSVLTGSGHCLLHASIRDNLLLAAPDATELDLWEALDAAQIGDHVRDLPDDLDTIAGARGYRFSGGEKQRLAIARTLLRNLRVLILDEATSALDNRTEREVQAAIERLMPVARRSPSRTPLDGAARRADRRPRGRCHLGAGRSRHPARQGRFVCRAAGFQRPFRQTRPRGRRLTHSTYPRRIGCGGGMPPHNANSPPEMGRRSFEGWDGASTSQDECLTSEP